jgi:putative endonuclease
VEPIKNEARKIAAASVGRKGEEDAVRALEIQGWEILERNFRTRGGEIDIVAKREETLVFFEVKTWKKNPRQDLSIAIDSKKRNKIIETSKIYLAKHRQYSNTRIRYDVLFLEADGTMTQYEGAFAEHL